jgi:hypothetical protein
MFGGNASSDSRFARPTSTANPVDLLELFHGDFTVSKTISGVTPKRTGTMLVPIPVVTNK